MDGPDPSAASNALAPGICAAEGSHAIEARREVACHTAGAPTSPSEKAPAGRCPCGNIFLEDAVFCRKCGLRRRCSCGNIFLEDASFCRKCGRPRREPKPCLYYFQFAGRGELTRLIAAAGGTQLDEAPEVTDTAGFGALSQSLPCLAHGSLKMGESFAIESYIAQISPGFKTLTPAQRAIDLQFCKNKDEMLTEYMDILTGLIKGSPHGLAASEVAKVGDKWFPVIERMLPAIGFLHGLQIPTAADLAVLNIAKGFMPFGAAYRIGGYNPMAKYPKLAVHVDRVARHPVVAAYLEKSTTMTADHMGLRSLLLEPPTEPSAGQHEALEASTNGMHTARAEAVDEGGVVEPASAHAEAETHAHEAHAHEPDAHEAHAHAAPNTFGLFRHHAPQETATDAPALPSDHHAATPTTTHFGDAHGDAIFHTTHSTAALDVDATVDISTTNDEDMHGDAHCPHTEAHEDASALSAHSDAHAAHTAELPREPTPQRISTPPLPPPAQPPPQADVEGIAHGHTWAGPPTVLAGNMAQAEEINHTLGATPAGVSDDSMSNHVFSHLLLDERLLQFSEDRQLDMTRRLSDELRDLEARHPLLDRRMAELDCQFQGLAEENDRFTHAAGIFDAVGLVDRVIALEHREKAQLQFVKKALTYSMQAYQQMNGSTPRKGLSPVQHFAPNTLPHIVSGGEAGNVAKLAAKVREQDEALLGLMAQMEEIQMQARHGGETFAPPAHDVGADVHRLETHLSEDLAEVRKQLQELQEVVDQRVLVPLWQLGQQLPEAGERVMTLSGQCQEFFSKVESQEVRWTASHCRLESNETAVLALTEKVSRLLSANPEFAMYEAQRETIENYRQQELRENGTNAMKEFQTLRDRDRGRLETPTTSKVFVEGSDLGLAPTWPGAVDSALGKDFRSGVHHVTEPHHGGSLAAQRAGLWDLVVDDSLQHDDGPVKHIIHTPFDTRFESDHQTENLHGNDDSYAFVAGISPLARQRGSDQRLGFQDLIAPDPTPHIIPEPTHSQQTPRLTPQGSSGVRRIARGFVHESELLPSEREEFANAADV